MDEKSKNRLAGGRRLTHLACTAPSCTFLHLHTTLYLQHRDPAPLADTAHTAVTTSTSQGPGPGINHLVSSHIIRLD